MAARQGKLSYRSLCGAPHSVRLRLRPGYDYTLGSFLPFPDHLPPLPPWCLLEPFLNESWSPASSAQGQLLAHGVCEAAEKALPSALGKPASPLCHTQAV